MNAHERREAELLERQKTEARALYQGRLAGKDDYALLDLIQYEGMDRWGIKYISDQIAWYTKEFLQGEIAAEESRALDIARVDRMLARIEDAFEAGQVGPSFATGKAGTARTPLPAMVTAFTKLLKLRAELLGHGLATVKVEGTINHTNTEYNTIDQEILALTKQLGMNDQRND